MAFFPPLSTKAGISSCFILVHPLGLFYLCSYLGSLWFWLFSATQEEIKKPKFKFPKFGKCQSTLYKISFYSKFLLWLTFPSSYDSGFLLQGLRNT